MKRLRVEFDLPVFLVAQAGLDVDNLGQEVRTILALFLYEHNKLSLSKACEIGGFSQWEFSEMNKKLGIPIHYTGDDLKEDLDRLSNV